jgi:hypothetical protein
MSIMLYLDGWERYVDFSSNRLYCADFTALWKLNLRCQPILHAFVLHTVDTMPRVRPLVVPHPPPNQKHILSTLRSRDCMPCIIQGYVRQPYHIRHRLKSPAFHRELKIATSSRRTSATDTSTSCTTYSTESKAYTALDGVRHARLVLPAAPL